MNGSITIDMNGNAVALKFGFPAVKEFNLAAVTNRTTFFNEKGEMSGIGIAKLIHAGYKNACVLKEIDPAITFEQFSDWVDECEENPDRVVEIGKVITVYGESRYTKKILEAIEPTEEDDKKKGTDSN